MTVPTLPEVRAGKAAAPEYLAAWRLQQEIKAAEEQLEAMKTRFAEMLKPLAGNGDGVFRVIGLQTVKTANPEWFRKNMPDIYNRCVSLTDTTVGKIMSEVYKPEEILEYCKDVNPQGFRRYVSLTKDNLKKIGKLTDKQINELPTGTDGAITINTRVLKTAHLEPLFPAPQLLENKEPEDED